jgi:hypothetical protein
MLRSLFKMLKMTKKNLIIIITTSDVAINYYVKIVVKANAQPLLFK